MTDYRIHRTTPPAAPSNRRAAAGTSPGAYVGAGAAGGVIATLLVVALVLGVAKGGWSWVVPSPSPVSEAGLKVLIIEPDPQQRHKVLTAGQREAMLATAKGSLREYVESKGGEFRLLDDNNDVSDDAAWVQALWKLEHKSLPWIVVVNGKRWTEGPLPEKAIDSLNLAKKYGE